MKKIKWIKQTDPKDCGPVCMAMLSKYYGLDISVTKLREYGGTDLQGTNIKGLMEIGEQIGFDVKGVRATDPQALNDLPLPAIAHIITPEGMAHFVIIELVKDDYITVVDPAKGREQLLIKDFLPQWTGVLILVSKNENFIEGHEGIKLSHLLAKLIAPNKSLLFSVFIASLFLNLFGFLGTFYFKFLVDDILPHQLLNNLHIISLGILILYILQSVLMYFRSHLILYFSMRTDITLMLGYYRHVIDLPLNFFETRKVGEIISRFMDASKIREAIASTAVTVMIDSLMLIVGTILLYFQNSTLFLMTLCFIPLYIILALSFRKPYEKYNRDQMIANAELNSYLVESLNGVANIKSYNAEDNIFMKTENYFVKLLKKIFKLGMIFNIQGAIKQFFDLATSLMILWVGSKFVIEGTMSLGDLLTFNALVIYFLGPIERLIGLQPTVQTAIVAAKRLGEIFDLELEKSHDDDQKVQTAFLENQIVFKDVSFKYGTRRNVLEDIQLTIKKGQQVAFVGTSGSGKTTISKLLVDFYQPQEGQIYFDDFNLSEISKVALRDHIAYVSQKDFFFSGSWGDKISGFFCGLFDCKNTIYRRP